jgi:hypothetical protein
MYRLQNSIPRLAKKRPACLGIGGRLESEYARYAGKHQNQEEAVTKIDKPLKHCRSVTTVLLFALIAVARTESKPHRQFGSIRDLRYIDGKWYAVVDYMSMFTGRQADRAAIADGALPAGLRIVNGYYVRNRSKRLRRVELFPRVLIRLLRTSGDRGRVSPEQLRRIVRKPDMRPQWYGIAEYGTPVWLEFKGKKVGKIEQVYFP